MKDNPYLARHKAQCSICASPYCQAIEEAFLNWQSCAWVAKQSGVTRDAIYRHAHAFDLFRKRRRNVLRCAENLLERADTHIPSYTLSGVVSLMQLYLKLIKEEEKAEAAQSPNLVEQLRQMAQEEREAFARDGSLPEWLLRAIGATPADTQGEKESTVIETPTLQ